MKEWLYPGAKVICVDDHFDDPRPLAVIAQECIPTTGQVYTVREVGFLQPIFPDTLCLRLVEITNPTKPYVYESVVIVTERCFSADRFRPLTKRPTDISVFTDLLHDVKRAEPVMLNTPWEKVEA